MACVFYLDCCFYSQVLLDLTVLQEMVRYHRACVFYSDFYYFSQVLLDLAVLLEIVHPHMACVCDVSQTAVLSSGPADQAHVGGGPPS